MRQLLRVMISLAPATNCLITIICRNLWAYPSHITCIIPKGVSLIISKYIIPRGNLYGLRHIVDCKIVLLAMWLQKVFTTILCFMVRNMTSSSLKMVLILSTLVDHQEWYALAIHQANKLFEGHV